MKALLALALLASPLAAQDTIRAYPGDSITIAVPSVVGRYWLDFRGPRSITQYARRSVVFVLQRPTPPPPPPAPPAAPPPTGSFAAPDILREASFEAGFDGFLTGNGTAVTGLTRTQSRAALGSWSLSQSWNRNTGDVSAQAFYDLGANRTHVFVRVYFYHTAWPNGGGYKFVRLQDDGYNTTSGIQVLNGRLTWITGNASYIAMAYLSGPLPSVNAWHWIEFELNIVAKEVRVWVDGIAQSFSVYYQTRPDLTVSGTTLRYGNATTAVPRYLDLLRVINPTTNAGSVYLDLIAVSTQRIGP